ncbi:SitI3 family protein [Allokutzneria sp. NRRL B-24872]|uniref:SitI3 family protein n=1 Tax=Allokutzneria sp. NRRL B-24872 TaxID=1137961 RepID=UPI000A3A0BF6|nr:SitI3 family protein [Allokutzneria sp. NRRL B-24872]
MAIDYSLEIATPLPPAEVAHALKKAAQRNRLLGAAVAPPDLLGDGVLTGHGTWVHVSANEPEPWDPVLVDLGLASTTTVTFRMGKSDPVHLQQDDVIALTVALLERVPGDAVLHFQLEVIWLLRRGGRLTITEQDDWWPPHRLTLLDIPYRRETHTFAD